MKKLEILVLSVLSAAFLLAGCSGNDSPFSEKSYDADAAEIEEVVIDVRDREIVVSLSEDDQIHITYFENEKEYYDISVSDGEVLTMTAQSNKKWTDYIGSNSAADFRKIALQIPDSLLSKLTLTTTNEDIALSPVTVTGDVSLSANGGNIAFDQINVGNSLTLTGKNGNISGTVIGSYDEFSIFAEIKKENSNAVLLLVGDGDLRGAIEEKVKSLGLADSVIFTGVRTDIDCILSAMDVFIMTSFNEGLPVSLVEAQASGLHIVATDTISSEINITDLVEFCSLDDSPKKWACTALKYADGYERRNTKAEIAAAGYDIVSTTEELKQFYLKNWHE